MTSVSFDGVGEPAWIAAEAQRIVENARYSTYQPESYIDEPAGIFDVDCSGFVAYVLERIAPDRLREIPKRPGENRPRACEYFEFFDSLKPGDIPGWQRVDTVLQCKRGDLVAWREPEILGESSGHVLMVAGEPEIRDDGVVAVPVYDSAIVPHFDDSRQAGGTHNTGVGMGILLFQVDGDGRAMGETFGPSEVFRKHAVALARVIETSRA